MKISVIVPVYNCEPYVARCVRSIMAQTHTDLEIICIDDGSSDGSGEILDALALEDKRLRVVHQANAGASAARNAGIDLATGDFITFVDSDDAIEPDMYETLLPYFNDKNVDIVHCGYKRIHFDGSVKDVNGTEKVVYQDKYEAADCLIAGRLYVGSLWNKLFRSHLFHSIRMDTQLIINEDVLVIAELLKQVNTAVYLDIGKYYFYERDASVTAVTKQQKKAVDCLVVAERMLALYTETPVESAAKTRVLNAQIGLYRYYVMNTLISSRQERKHLAQKIGSSLDILPPRQRANYVLMRYAPHLYKLLYTIYDKIRVPNWDVV